MKRRLSPRDDSGQSLVETAVIVPILTLLLVGAAELARVAYAAIEVSSAARAGVQYGAQSGMTASDTTGIASAAQMEAANVSGLITNSSSSCECSDGTASTCANSDCANSHIEQTLTVTTEATVDPVIHLPGLPKTYKLRGQAVQKCLQ